MRDRKRQKKRIIFFIAGIGLVLAVAGGAFLWNNLKNNKSDDLKFIESAQAEDGTLKKDIKNKDLQRALQNETNKQKFTFGINSNIELEDGFAAGAFCIENPTTNHFQMQVVIRQNDTKEIIYKTAEINPGYGIESARLSKRLKKGNYPCTAVISALEKGEKTGEVQVPVMIKIKS